MLIDERQTGTVDRNSGSNAGRFLAAFRRIEDYMRRNVLKEKLLKLHSSWLSSNSAITSSRGYYSLRC